MSATHTDGTDREKRWMLLCEDGRHSWLGRHSDPTDDEVAALSKRLDDMGLGGWLTVCEGDYWGGRHYTVLEVRRLADGGTFEIALAGFLKFRDQALAEH